MEDDINNFSEVSDPPVTLAEVDELDSSTINSEELDSQITEKVDRYGFIGGQQYTDPTKEYRTPVEVIRSREMKWMAMCKDWDYWITTGRKRLTERCRKGVPDSVRGEAWQRLVGSPITNVKQVRVYVNTDTTIPTKSPARSLFRTSSRLNSSRSLPTVITNSPNLNKNRSREMSSKVSNAIPIPTSTTSPFASRSFAQRKQSNGFKSFRKLGFLFRLNTTQKEDDTKKSEEGKLEVSQGKVIQPPLSPYSPTLPSAAYLGLPTNSDSTTTSTGVSTDACSLTTSSNFLSAADSSSLQSLNNMGGCGGDEVYHSPGVDGTRGMNRQLNNSLASSSAYSSHFSTLSSRASRDSDSPTPSLLDRPPLQRAADRDGTLVAPSNSGSVQQSSEPFTLFAEYAEKEGDQATMEQIKKDIHRQFPFHELFCSKNSHGRESLFTVLKAYTIRHAGKGYCQGQAPLAAVLLMFMPETEAFWAFNEICERYLIAYYDEGLERIQIDGNVLFGLLKRTYPQIHKFLINQGVDPLHLVVEWFMCMYTRTLPWVSVLRLLDIFFCEGKIIIFKVGLVLLHHCFASASFRKSCDGIDEILTRVREIPATLDNPDELIRDVIRVPVTKHQLAREVAKQSQRWRSRMEAVVEGTNEK